MNTASESDSPGKLIVIGASLGGVAALQRLAADLPADFPVPVLIVLHIGANQSRLPDLLAAAGPNTASHARDGEPLRTGHLAVAPPGRHLLVNDGTVRLTRGPKENWARPAIDPLFRSAALAFGARAIGIVLTGNLDDGTAGLQAIKSCGGLAVVQDPATAFAPSMPASALQSVAVDYVLPIEAMGAQLRELIMQSNPPSPSTPDRLRLEHAAANGAANVMQELQKIARPSGLVCPECGGSLWEICEARPSRYRCHTGHAFTLKSLESAMDQGTEATIWSAIRALQERAVLSRQMAERHADTSNLKDAAALEARAAADEDHANKLRSLIEES
ncbi:MAG TPA: chemotaxis protein CheB [Steroidobacteraceae bacterium]|jgi:two-component system chemotaxis response regulator CheB|nr:chemotaxis protein CheB [Steroidobacteraceae bacterium]